MGQRAVPVGSPITLSADEGLATAEEVSGGDRAGGALSEAMSFLQEELGAADRVEARKAGISNRP
jgi:hypothetical protein